MNKKPNLIISQLRLFFRFCPNCNSDAPKKYTCKICNNGQYKSRKDLKFRFEMFDLLHLPDEEKNKMADNIDWILRINNIYESPLKDIFKTK